MNKAFSLGGHDKRVTGEPAVFARRQRGFRVGSTIERAMDAVGQSVKAFAEGVAEGRRMSRLYDELTAKSGGDLAKLGISRADILAVVAGRKAVANPNLNGLRTRSPSPGRSDQPSDQGAST